MRFLAILVISAGLLYSGYWFIGASSVESGAGAAIEDLQADNWRIDIADVNTRGFPSRFDTTLTDVNVTTPDGALTYRAPFLQALALSYAPNKVILAFANEQTVEIAGQSLGIMSEGLKASAAVQASTSAALEDITIESGPMTVVSDVGWDTALSSVLAALRHVNGTDQTYDLYGDFKDIALPRVVAEAIGEVTPLPGALQSVRVDMRAELTAPLDRFAFAQEGAAPVLPTSLLIRRMEAKWGASRVAAEGQMTFDSMGSAVGELNVTLVEWDSVIDALVRIGAIESDLADTVRSVLSSMAQGETTLTIPVTFRNGQSFVGLIPIGPAPKL